jgi:hypothetical protein
MNKILGLLQIICGIGLWMFGVTIGLSWLAFCFGSVVIGILLLFFAPYIIFLPFSFGIVPGNGMILMGITNFRKHKTTSVNNLDGL